MLSFTRSTFQSLIILSTQLVSEPFPPQMQAVSRNQTHSFVTSISRRLEGDDIASELPSGPLQAAAHPKRGLNGA